jgi:hypothetical protein
LVPAIGLICAGSVACKHHGHDEEIRSGKTLSLLPAIPLGASIDVAVHEERGPPIDPKVVRMGTVGILDVAMVRNQPVSILD